MSLLDLPWYERVHRRLHNAGASLGAPGWFPVAMVREGDHLRIDTDKRPIRVPAADRWLHYRWGWDKRVARLQRHFSVDDLIKVAPGDQVIDIGANVGEFSLGMADRGARVLALEGDPTVFGCLSKNVEGTQIEAKQALVWKAEEELTFYSAPAKADSSIFRPPSNQQITEIRLPAQPLDALAAHLDGIDLIKCDAEGAEPEVLEGGKDVLARTRQIALDTGPEREGAETGEECERILKGMGFDVVHSQKGRKITFGIRPS